MFFAVVGDVGVIGDDAANTTPALLLLMMIVIIVMTWTKINKLMNDIIIINDDKNLDDDGVGGDGLIQRLVRGRLLLRLLVRSLFLEFMVVQQLIIIRTVN